MPIFYCEACHKETQHKQVLRKRTFEEASLRTKLQGFRELMSQLVSGQHYHKMDQVCLCRDCNHVNYPEMEEQHQIAQA